MESLWRRKLESTSRKYPAIIIGLILLAFWQVSVDIGMVERFTLPSPMDILSSFGDMGPVLFIHIRTTLIEALSGFAISIVLSLILSIIMDSIPFINDGLRPFLVISQTIPIIVLAPLFAIWFGFGILPKIIVVVLVCFFPMLLSLLEGLNSIDKDLINLLKSMGASKYQIYREVKFPAALFSFFSGLKISATYSIMGAVIGEWLGGKDGLGVYMLRLKHSFQLDKVFAVILVIILLSLFLFKIIELIQIKVTPWTKKH
jgi:ABC-type nitrate/sulfonate/bicarbonate transport system permease component